MRLRSRSGCRLPRVRLETATGLVLFLAAWLASVSGTLRAGGGADASAAFDEANKLYEVGLYPQAAEAYQALINAHGPSVNALFNLGDARFRAGEIGLAIASFRRAQRLAPRDPDIRFNLSFARKAATGRETPPGTAWSRSVALLTLDEWTLLATTAFWIWFLLLGLREYRPRFRSLLKSHTAVAGAATVVIAVGFGASAYDYFVRQEAVVVVPKAVVRIGPLQESQVHYQLPNGSELTVLGEKKVGSSGLLESWLEVSDAAGRKGWLRRTQVERLDD